MPQWDGSRFHPLWGGSHRDCPSSGSRANCHGAAAGPVAAGGRTCHPPIRKSLILPRRLYPAIPVRPAGRHGIGLSGRG